MMDILMDRLPLQAAIGLKRTAAKDQFAAMYAPYWEITVESDHYASFLKKLENHEEMSLILLTTELVAPGPKEEKATSFQDLVQDLLHRYPNALIHLLLNRNEDFSELRNTDRVFINYWNERNYTDEIIQSRLATFFQIPTKDLKKRKKQFSKIRSNPTLAQTTIMDFGLDVSVEKLQSLPQKEELVEIVCSEFEKESAFIAGNPLDDLLPLGIESDYDNTGSEFIVLEDNNELGEYYPPEGEDESAVTAAAAGANEDNKDDESRNVKNEAGKNVVNEEGERAPEYPDLQATKPYELSSLTREHMKRIIFSALRTRENYFRIKGSQAKIVGNKVIAVVNLYDQCGASFVAHNFALYLGNQGYPVGVLEIPQSIPMLYHKLGGHKSQPRQWEPWYSNIRKQTMRYEDVEHKNYDVPCLADHLWWQKHHVQWIPVHPDTQNEDVQNLNLSELYSLFGTANDIPILLVDLSSNIEAWFSKIILEQADEVWIIMEPRLERARYYGQKFKLIHECTRTQDIFCILNRDYPFIKKKDFLSFLKHYNSFLSPQPLTTIPYATELNQIEAEQKFAYLDPKGKEYLNDCFSPLLERFTLQKREGQSSFSERKKLFSFRLR
jgi:hypothetical protein